MGDPGDAQIALRAAEALYAEGKVAESEAAFGALLNTGMRAEALFGLGIISYAARNLSRAQALFEQSLGVERRRPDTLYYLGRTLLDRGLARKAITYFAEALTYQPHHEAAMRDLIAAAGSSPPSANPPGPTPSARAAAAATAGPGAPASPSSAKASSAAQPTQAAGPPELPNDPHALVGVVRQLVKGVGPWRGSPAALQIWTFRVEQPSAGHGEPPRLVGVEMRAMKISGTLENGDWVEIGERPKPGEGYRPRELRNLSTHDVVKATSPRFAQP